MAPRRFVPLVDLMAGRADDVSALIISRRVEVDGRVIDNPAALVPEAAAVVIRPERVLQGTRKLRAVLGDAGVDPSGRACLDVGAAAGGFTSALLEAGARIVYALDAGYGQLTGALRQDPRVVNLERTNLAELDRSAVPEPVDLVTVDLSYLSLARALPQLAPLALTPGAELLALVKPTFELHRSRLASGEDDVDQAGQRAAEAAVASGWIVVGVLPSPVPGRGGAREAFLHARWQPDGPSPS